MQIRSRFLPVIAALIGVTPITNASLAQAIGAPAALLPTAGKAMVPNTEQLALARQLVTVIGLDADVARVVQATSEPAARQFNAQLAPLPQAKRRAALEQFTVAMSQAEAAHVKRELEHVAQNYASRMTEEQLKNLLALYGTPLGQKMVRYPQSMTIEERQEAGRYTVAHPGTVEAITALLSSAKIDGPWQVSEQHLFQDGFRNDLCGRLRKLAINYSICTVAGSIAASAQLAPDDYPALAVRMHHEGIVRYRVGYGQDGAVSSCTVIGTSGYPELDTATCAILRRRAHARPVQAGTVTGAISWKLPT